MTTHSFASPARTTRQALQVGAALSALAALAMLAGCTSLQPCDHQDLQDKYGFLCTLRGVGTRNQPQHDARGFLVGTVSDKRADRPIVVFAYRKRANVVEVVEASMLSGPGAYSITVPAGIYRIAAFEDGDGDGRYDAMRERATQYHEGGAVAVRSGERVDRLYLQIRDDRPQRLDFEFVLPESSVQACCDVPAPSNRSGGTRQ